MIASKAFTLIELLVVIILLSFVLSIVSPAGYRLYEGVLNYIEEKEQEQSKRQLRYEAFIHHQANKENNISIMGAVRENVQNGSNND